MWTQVALAARLALAALWLWPALCRGGGFDIPDIGTEPIGRGGTFVAKADSPLALYYNVAGMARQRGTRLLLDVGMIYHDTAFTAEGTYGGSTADPMMRTPYATQPYPTMRDGQNWSPIPFLGVTTDFGFFKTLTFGLSVQAPPAIGSHAFGSSVNVPFTSPTAIGTSIGYQTKLANGMSAPAPTRYDLASTNLIILLPTFGVAWQPIKYFSIGAAAQLVYANFDLTNANYTALGTGLCPTPEYSKCDGYAQIKTSGVAGLGIFSVMAHPTAWLDIGATYRMGTNVHTTGSKPNNGLIATQPSAYYVFPPPTTFDASLDTRLPDWVRLGIRGVRRYADGTEHYDLELDLTYENWSSVHYDKIYAADFSPFGNTLEARIPHFYKDTFGVRLGGAYNHRLSDLSRIIGRLGIYYDSASTNNAETHLDFQTADKFGFTAGFGYKVKGFTLNLGYAFIYSPPRTVTNSSLRAFSSTDGSIYPDSDTTCAGANASNVLCHYGNGKYDWSTQILSLGLTFNFSEFKVPTLMRN